MVRFWTAPTGPVLLERLPAPANDVDSIEKPICLEAGGQNNHVRLGHLPALRPDALGDNLHDWLVGKGEVLGVNGLQVSRVEDAALTPQGEVGSEQVVELGRRSLPDVPHGGLFAGPSEALAGLGEEEASHGVLGVEKQDQTGCSQHAGDVGEEDLEEFGVGDGDGGDEPVLGSDELAEMVRLVDDGGHDLTGGAAVAQQDDLLARDVDVSSPFGRVEEVSPEGVCAGNIRGLGPHQNTRGAEEELAFVDKDVAVEQVPDMHAPPVRRGHPLAANDL